MPNKKVRINDISSDTNQVAHVDHDHLRPRRDGGRGDPAVFVARRTSVHHCVNHIGTSKP